MLYEIRKLLSRRALILWGIFLLISSLFLPLTYTYRHNKFIRETYGDVDKIYEEMWKRYGAKQDSLYWAGKSVEENKRTGNTSYFATPISEYELYLAKTSARTTGKSRPLHFDSNMEKHSLQGIEAQLLEMEDTDGYRYRNLMKEKTMMERCELTYIDVDFWNQFELWEFAIVLLTFLFVLFTMSGAYIKERSNNMNYVLCTSRIGYLRIIADKWLAGCLLGIGSIVIVNVNLAVALILCGSSRGYDVNIVNLGVELVYTPYNINIGEYMLIKIVFQSVGMMFLVVFAQYISLKNSYRWVVVLYGGLLFLPQFVSYIAIGREWFKIMDFIFDWSLFAAIYTGHVFYKYHSFNILGNPVNYPTVYLVLLMVLTILIGILTVKKYHKNISQFNRC